jgi:hypothetical protein
MDASTQGTIAGRWRQACAAWLLFAGFAMPATAQVVYRCEDTEGRVAYQDRACADARRSSLVEIAPAPTASAPPEYAGTPPARAGGRTPSRRGRPRAEVMSFECRADNGEVFFRHTGCPGSIRVDAAQARSGKAVASARVSAVRVPRKEACRRLGAAGSSGRAGHARDEQVSTYDRNAGRDPCRRH